MNTHVLSRAAAALVLAASLASAEQVPSSADDTYRFVSGKGDEKTVTYAATGSGVSFAWPGAANAGWDTALVSARIAAEPGAEPWVEMVAGSARAKLYLDADG